MECLKNVYMTHPFLFSYQAQKRTKIVQPNPWSDLLKTWYAHKKKINFGSNIGWIPPCYTSSYLCAKQKSAKKKRIMLGPKELYIFV